MINKLVSKWFLVVLLGILAVTIVFGNAYAKKEKVGSIANGWYADGRFGFSVAITEDWKDAGLKDEPNPERLSLVWRKPRVPMKLKDQPNEAIKPYVRIYADSTKLTATALFDTLHVGVTKDAFRDKILSKSVFFERGISNDPEIQPVSTIKIGGRTAYRWSVKREYSVQVQKDLRSSPELVRDYRTGYVYIVPGEGWLMYIEMACENQFRDEMDHAFQEVASSITFRAPTEASADSSAAKPQGSE